MCYCGSILCNIVYFTLKCRGCLLKTQQISLLGLRLNLSCNILVHSLEQPSLIIKQSGATSRRWEPNSHQTYSLICSQDNKYGCLIFSGRQLHKWCPHMQSRSTWEMGMTVACRRCQSWSNTMAKGRMVSRRAPWKMKNASALYFELMDGVSENKEERGRERQKIERKVLRLLWRGIILVTCLFSPHSLFIWTCASAYTHRKTLCLAKGLKKMKVNSSICLRRG